MTLKLAQFCDDPKKISTKSSYPKKVFIFLKTQKNIEIQNYEPKKMGRAYVCVKISEYPPGPAISHCSHLLLKCRVATNTSHWLKVHSRSFQKYISAKTCILISFWIFQYCFYYSFTLYYCAIFNSLNAGFFSKLSGCQTVWTQIRPEILSGLIWVQTVC